MIKKIITLILMFFVSSCSLDGYKEQRDFRLSNKMHRDSSAVLITRVNASSETHDGKGFESNFAEMNWCKSDEKKRCEEIFYFSPYTRRKFYSQYNYYSINPGLYYLDEIKQQPDHPEYWILVPLSGYFGPLHGIKANFNTSLPGWNKKLNAPNYASFEANAGEIVYIGDLIFTFTKQKYWPRGKANLVVEDNYEDAVRYFYEKHPEFKNQKVIKRLVQPGVMLDDFKGGFFW